MRTEEPIAMPPDDELGHDLRGVLYDGLYETVHAPLARLWSGDEFARRDGAVPAERTAASYRALRAVNDEFGARRIIGEPELLVALHEWAAVSDITLFALLSPHYNLCLGTLSDLGYLDHEDPGVRALVEELLQGSSIGLYMMTELGYGTSAHLMRTTAVYDRAAGRFSITTPAPVARKYMPSAASAEPKIAVVMAQLVVDGVRHGVHPFLVRLRDDSGPLPGVAIDPLPDKPGLCTDNALTTFHQVSVPHVMMLPSRAGRLSRDGVHTSELPVHRRLHAVTPRLPLGRVCIAAAATASSRAALQITIRYGLQRMIGAGDRDDVPLMSLRSYRHRILPHLATAYAMTLLTNHARRLVTAGNQDGTAVSRADHVSSLTKAVATRAAERAISECRQRCGAQGMFSANRLIDYMIFSHGTVTAEGDNEALFLKVAGEIIAGSGYEPPEPYDQAPTDNLLDEEFWLYAARQRERSLRAEIDRRLQECAQATDSFAEAWDRVAVQGAELAACSGHRQALELFVEAVAGLEETGRMRSARVLRRLAGLFALAEMERAGVWLVQAGLLGIGQVGRIPQAIEDLCDAIAPTAESLIEAFGLPEEIVDAPIAYPLGDYAELDERLSGRRGPRGRPREA